MPGKKVMVEMRLFSMGFTNYLSPSGDFISFLLLEIRNDRFDLNQIGHKLIWLLDNSGAMQTEELASFWISSRLNWN